MNLSYICNRFICQSLHFLLIPPCWPCEFSHTKGPVAFADKSLWSSSRALKWLVLTPRFRGRTCQLPPLSRLQSAWWVSPSNVSTLLANRPVVCLLQSSVLRQQTSPTCFQFAPLSWTSVLPNCQTPIFCKSYPVFLTCIGSFILVVAQPPILETFLTALSWATSK